MLKPAVSILIIVILSLLVVMATPYAQQILNWLLAGHEWVSHLLTDVFSGGEVGSVIRNALALLAVPIFVGLIPAIIFGLAKRGWFPYFMHVVWVTWLVQTAALLIQGKTS